MLSLTSLAHATRLLPSREENRPAGWLAHLEAILALAQVREIDGRRPIGFHVKTQMFHEFHVVHKELLAQVTLERHVRLELTSQHLGKKKKKKTMYFWLGFYCLLSFTSLKEVQYGE